LARCWHAAARKRRSQPPPPVDLLAELSALVATVTSFTKFTAARIETLTADRRGSADAA